MRRLLALATMSLLASFFGILSFALLNPAPDPASVAKTDVIIVLGAGMDANGRLHRSTRLRVAKGVDLWANGRAPRMHFTGGQAAPDGVSAGEAMALLAQGMGVPVGATSFEGRSLSTLQNALFSQPMLSGEQSARLVTEGFHLPRSWLSFKWAAWHVGAASPKLYLSHSERLRQGSPSARLPRLTMVTRETGALWFNAARVIGYEVARLLRIPVAQRDPWLN